MTTSTKIWGWVAGALWACIIVAIIFLACTADAHAATCSWDKPGASPFMGNVPAAVDRYKDIPAAVRAKLKKRMAQRKYDEIAEIRRDSITGKDSTYTNLRQMHFGAGKVCDKVNRSKWKDTHVERGLIYCEGQYCIIVPTVCRNVSRVDRGDPPLVFDPPGAGPAPTPTPQATPPATYPPTILTPPGVPDAPPYTFRSPPDPFPWFPGHGGGGGGGGWVSPPVPPVQPPAGPPTNPPGEPPGVPPSVPPGNPEPPVGPPDVPPPPPGTPSNPPGPPIPPVNPPVWPVNPPVAPPVPEPETWAMLLAGAALVRYVTRKKPCL